MLFAWRKTMTLWRTFGEHRPWASEVNLFFPGTNTDLEPLKWAFLGWAAYLDLHKFDIISHTHSSQRRHTEHHTLNRFKTGFFFSTSSGRKSFLGREHQALAIEMDGPSCSLVLSVFYKGKGSGCSCFGRWQLGSRQASQEHPVRGTNQWFSCVDSVWTTLFWRLVCLLRARQLSLLLVPVHLRLGLHLAMASSLA